MKFSFVIWFLTKLKSYPNLVFGTSNTKYYIRYFLAKRVPLKLIFFFYNFLIFFHFFKTLSRPFQWCVCFYCTSSTCPFNMHFLYLSDPDRFFYPQFLHFIPRLQGGGSSMWSYDDLKKDPFRYEICPKKVPKF